MFSIVEQLERGPRLTSTPQSRTYENAVRINRLMAAEKRMYRQTIGVKLGLSEDDVKNALVILTKYGAVKRIKVPNATRVMMEYVKPLD